MIDTAGTICHAMDALAEAGAAVLMRAVPHPVLSGPATTNMVVAGAHHSTEDDNDKIEQISPFAETPVEAIARN